MQKGTCGRQPQSALGVLPKRKPLTQLRAPQWECWLAASARGGEKASFWTGPLALDHSTTHRPCCPGWRFCSPLTLKGHSQVQGQTHRTGSLGLGCPLSSCLQRLKEDSLVPSALSTTLAATLTVNYKSLKYPFSFLDLETENMRENQLK